MGAGWPPGVARPPARVLHPSPVHVRGPEALRHLPVPDDVRRLVPRPHLALAGDRAGAAVINAALTPRNRALFVEANPIPVKWALQQLGLIEEGIRLPLTPLDEAYRQQVQAALEAAGI